MPYVRQLPQSVTCLLDDKVHLHRLLRREGLGAAHAAGLLHHMGGGLDSEQKEKVKVRYMKEGKTTCLLL